MKNKPVYAKPSNLIYADFQIFLIYFLLFHIKKDVKIIVINNNSL